MKSSVGSLSAPLPCRPPCSMSCSLVGSIVRGGDVNGSVVGTDEAAVDVGTDVSGTVVVSSGTSGLVGPFALVVGVGGGVVVAGASVGGALASGVDDGVEEG